MTSMTDNGVSVMLSSHAIAELERMADYLIVLGDGELRLAGETDELLAEHRVLTGPVAQADRVAARLSPIQDKRAGAQAHLLIRRAGCANDGATPPGWEAHPVSLEEVILAYLRPTGGSAPSTGSLAQLTEATR
jgi:ABC-2 type transport system ATP-binding protein